MNKHILIRICLTAAMLCITSLLVFTQTQEANDKVLENLQTIEKLVDREVTWTFSPGDGELAGEYLLGTRIPQPNFELQTELRGIEFFCGMRVMLTPMHLKLKFISKGNSTVHVWIDDKQTESFDINGPKDQLIPFEKEIIISSSIHLQDYKLRLNIENKDNDHFFSIVDDSIIFPATTKNRQIMDGWILSMKNALILLSSNDRTGTPHNTATKSISKRKTPNYEKLKKAFDTAVMKIKPIDLKLDFVNDIEAVVQESYDVLSPFRKYIKDYKIYITGNSDTLSPEKSTSANQSFDLILDRMKKYPELINTQGQAAAYEWIERNNPSAFGQIGKSVKSDTWEIIGGTWGYLTGGNISSENYIRQFLYGKRYFKDKFGTDVMVGCSWNPDPLFVDSQIPQILEKCGIKYLVTSPSKEYGNLSNSSLSWWQGIDGSKILLYSPSSMDSSKVKLPNYISNIVDLEAKTGSRNSLVVSNIIRNDFSSEKEFFDRVKLYKNVEFAPEFIYSGFLAFLSKIEDELEGNIPVWNNQTSKVNSAIEKNSRDLDALFLCTEKFSAAAFMMGANYPSEMIEKNWKSVLADSIFDAADSSKNNRDTIRKELSKQVSNSLSFIVKNIDTKSIQGIPVIVFNPFSSKQEGQVSIKIALTNNQNVKVVDIYGKDVPVNIERKPETAEVSVFFNAKDVPSLGYTLFSVQYPTETGENKISDISSIADITQINSFPLIPLITDKHAGSLPGELSFFEVKPSSSGVTLEVVKKAEGDNGIILRLMESSGKDSEIELSFFKVPKKIYETDLMEKKINDHRVSGKSLRFKIKKHEIKTLKLLFD